MIETIDLGPWLTGPIRKPKRINADAKGKRFERSLVDALADGALHVDELVRRTRVETGRTLETLLALELRGVVAQRPGMRFERADISLSGGHA